MTRPHISKAEALLDEYIEIFWASKVLQKKSQTFVHEIKKSHTEHILANDEEVAKILAL